MARPRIEIDLSELERLCVLQCTYEEIAAWFNVCTRVIERRRTEPAFAAAMDRGRAKGRISVRRAQMKMLEAGNATMGVWLGKQLLGQTDYITHNIDLSSQLTVVLPRPGLAPATHKFPAIEVEAEIVSD